MIVDFGISILDLRFERRGARARRRPICAQSQIAIPKSKIHRAYSFPEVLFAVIVLGIGLIMIAAIFPVAIAQNKATVDETTASSIARNAASVMASLAIDNRTQTANPPSTLLVPTGTAATNLNGVVRPIDSLIGWNAIRGNLILADDPRYAFVPLYRRDGDPTRPATWSGSAQIYVIAVQVRTRAAYTPADDLNFIDVKQAAATPIKNQSNLAPRPVLVKLTDNYSNTGVDIVSVNATGNPPTPSPGTNDTNRPEAVAEGAYLIMLETGRVYRVGVERPDIVVNNETAYELQPGNDLKNATENINNFANGQAWCVGRERSRDGTTFDGLAQDIAIYTTFIPVKP
jgi:hypothetical protein